MHTVRAATCVFKWVMSDFRDAMVVSSTVMTDALRVDVKNLIVYEIVSYQSLTPVIQDYLAVIGNLTFIPH